MSDARIKLGRGLAWAGSAMSILTGAAHTIAVLTEPDTSGNAGMDRVTEVMRSTSFPMMGVTRTMAQLMEGLGWYFSIYAFGFGLVPIVLLVSREATPGVLRRVLFASALVSAPTVVVSALLTVPPPMVMLGIVTVCFAAGAACLRGGARAA